MITVEAGPGSTGNNLFIARCVLSKYLQRPLRLPTTLVGEIPIPAGR